MCRYDSSKSWEELLTTYLDDDGDVEQISSCHLVVAYGFERIDNIQITVHSKDNQEQQEGVMLLSTSQLDQYDHMTGEILAPSDHHIGLFGGGIAFPQDYLDDDGEIEPWVGFKRSIEQTALMIETYHTHHNNNAIN